MTKYFLGCTFKNLEPLNVAFIMFKNRRTSSTYRLLAGSRAVNRLNTLSIHKLPIIKMFFMVSVTLYF